MNASPDFSTVELGDSPAPNDLNAWAARVAAEPGRGRGRPCGDTHTAWGSQFKR